MEEKELQNHLERLKDSDVGRRLKELSSLFLGTTYKLHPLNDDDELYNFREVDCVTFIEQVLALSFINDFDQFLQTLISIRYKEGQVDFYHRNHFFSADWIPNNKSFLRRVGAFASKTVSKQIDKESFFTKRGYNVPEHLNLPLQISVDYDYLPANEIDSLQDFAGDEPGPYLLTIVGNKENVIVTHVGFVVYSGEQEEPIFRHASSDKGEVVDTNLKNYVHNRSNCRGVTPFQLQKPGLPL